MPKKKAKSVKTSKSYLRNPTTQKNFEKKSDKAGKRRTARQSAVAAVDATLASFKVRSLHIDGQSSTTATTASSTSSSGGGDGGTPLTVRIRAALNALSRAARDGSAGPSGAEARACWALLATAPAETLRSFAPGDWQRMLNITLTTLQAASVGEALGQRDASTCLTHVLTDHGGRESLARDAARWIAVATAGLLSQNGKSRSIWLTFLSGMARDHADLLQSSFRRAGATAVGDMLSAVVGCMGSAAGSGKLSFDAAGGTRQVRGSTADAASSTMLRLRTEAALALSTIIAGATPQSLTSAGSAAASDGKGGLAATPFSAAFLGPTGTSWASAREQLAEDAMVAEESYIRASDTFQLSAVLDNLAPSVVPSLLRLWHEAVLRGYVVHARGTYWCARTAQQLLRPSETSWVPDVFPVTVPTSAAYTLVTGANVELATILLRSGRRSDAEAVAAFVTDALKTGHRVTFPCGTTSTEALVALAATLFGLDEHMLRDSSRCQLAYALASSMSRQHVVDTPAGRVVVGRVFHLLAVALRTDPTSVTLPEPADDEMEREEVDVSDADLEDVPHALVEACAAASQWLLAPGTSTELAAAIAHAQLDVARVLSVRRHASVLLRRFICTPATLANLASSTDTLSAIAAEPAAWNSLTSSLAMFVLFLDKPLTQTSTHAACLDELMRCMSAAVPAKSRGHWACLVQQMEQSRGRVTVA
eukprot:CAMPEP_0170745848 /NCGR_PEP_ID=MMETSP0437-20130122/8502_1 /TAXON_ID=0 /ORGANISM="Sexangularia sp." /LENGTH=707 /DNA_ID=CAMNT_0011084575 /DNA_START=74 /DNA_END=2197 /DNA_ORIENTATION=-